MLPSSWRYRGRRNNTSSSDSDSDHDSPAVGMTSAIQRSAATVKRGSHDGDTAIRKILPELRTRPSSNYPYLPASPDPSSEHEDVKNQDRRKHREHEQTAHSFHTKRRNSAASAHQAQSGSSLLRSSESVVHSNSNSSRDNTLDIPLAVAIIPPLGSLIIGGNFAYDFLLLLLMFFYLHQLIKLPWELYLACRPRNITRGNADRSKTIPSTDVRSIPEHLHDLYTLAESELKLAEFIYLGLSVLSPLIGAALLRYVCTALAGRDYISWFSTSVFVLVTGIRPWGHLSHRLKERTEDLQETVLRVRDYCHTSEMKDGDENGPEMLESMSSRIEVLESAATNSKETMKRVKHELEISLNIVDAALDKLSSDFKQQLTMIDERVGKLEKVVRDWLLAVGDDKGTAGGNRETRERVDSMNVSEDNWFATPRTMHLTLGSDSRFENNTSRNDNYIFRSDGSRRRQSTSSLLPVRIRDRSPGIPKAKSGPISITRIRRPSSSPTVAALRRDNFALSYWLKWRIESALETILELVAGCFGAGRRWVFAFGEFVKRSFA